MKTIIEVDGTRYDLYSDLGWVTDFPHNYRAPEVRTNYKEIPGRNGLLDLTEIDGHVYYQQREFTIQCQKLIRTSPNIFTYGNNLLDLFHGKEANVYLDYVTGGNDNYYYQSRLSVGAFNRSGINMTVDIDVSAFPYRLKENATVVNKAVSGTGSVTLSNTAMEVVPSITCDANFTLAFNNESVTISSGSGIIIPDLVLPSDGNLTISLTGTGNISFTYQQGKF